MVTFIPRKEWLADLEEQAKRRLSDTIGGVQSAGQEALGAAGEQIDQAAQQAQQAKDDLARQAQEYLAQQMEALRQQQQQAAQEQQARDAQRQEEERQRQETADRQRQQAQEAFQQGPVGQALGAVGEKAAEVGQGASEFGQGLVEEAGDTAESARQAAVAVQEKEREALRKLTGQGPEGPEPTDLGRQVEGGLGYLVPPQYRVPGEFAGEFVKAEGGSPEEQAAARGAVALAGPGGVASSLQTGIESQAPNLIRALPAAGAVLGGAIGAKGAIEEGAPPGEVFGEAAQGAAVGAGIGELGTATLPAAGAAARRFVVPGAQRVGEAVGRIGEAAGFRAPGRDGELLGRVLPSSAASTPGEPGYRYVGVDDRLMGLVEKWGGVPPGLEARLEPSLAASDTYLRGEASLPAGTENPRRVGTLRFRDDLATVDQAGRTLQSVPNRHVEIYGDDGQWHPFQGFRNRPEYGIPSREMGGAPEQPGGTATRPFGGGPPKQPPLMGEASRSYLRERGLNPEDMTPDEIEEALRPREEAAYEEWKRQHGGEPPPPSAGQPAAPEPGPPSQEGVPDDVPEYGAFRRQFARERGHDLNHLTDEELGTMSHEDFERAMLEAEHQTPTWGASGQPLSPGELAARVARRRQSAAEAGIDVSDLSDERIAQMPLSEWQAEFGRRRRGEGSPPPEAPGQGAVPPAPRPKGPPLSPADEAEMTRLSNKSLTEGLTPDEDARLTDLFRRAADENELPPQGGMPGGMQGVLPPRGGQPPDRGGLRWEALQRQVGAHRDLLEGIDLPYLRGLSDDEFSDLLGRLGNEATVRKSGLDEALGDWAAERGSPLQPRPIEEVGPILPGAEGPLPHERPVHPTNRPFALDSPRLEDAEGPLDLGPERANVRATGGLHPEDREEFLWRAGLGARRSAGVGALAGGAAGGLSAGPDATPEERAKRIALGAAGGSLALGAGRYGGSLALVRLAEQGKLRPELFATHPDFANRVRAMMLAAADATPEGELVKTPALLDFLRGVDATPEEWRALGDLRRVMGGGLYADEVRTLIAQQAHPNEVWDAAQRLLVDAVSGAGMGPARRMEHAADLVSARAVQTGAYRGSEYRSGASPGSLVGLQETADRLSRFLGFADDALPEIVLDQGEAVINAGAIRDVEGGHYILVTQGFLDALRRGQMTESEAMGVLAHEMGHFLPGGYDTSLQARFSRWFRQRFPSRGVVGGDGADGDLLGMARPGRPGKGPEYQGPAPTRESRDFEDRRPSLRELRSHESGKITGLEAQQAIAAAMRAARGKSAEDQEIANAYVEFVKDLIPPGREQQIQVELERIRRSHTPEEYDAAVAKLRGMAPEAEAVGDLGPGLGEGLGPGEGGAGGPPPPATPEAPPAAPDEGPPERRPMPPKPEGERTPRQLTPEQEAARNAEIDRREALREEARQARARVREAERLATEADRAELRARTADEIAAAREAKAAARKALREAEQQAREAERGANAAWANASRASEGQMPLDIAAMEGTGAQTSLPEEAPPSTPEAEAFTARQAARERARTEALAQREGEIQTRLGEPVPPEQAERPLQPLPGRPELPVDTPGELPFREGLPPLTPEQQEIADRLAAAEATRGPRPYRKQPNDVGPMDFAQAARYSGLLSRPRGMIQDYLSGPSEMGWKLARDLVTETTGKVTGRGGHPSAVAAEAAAMLDSLSREGWSIFDAERRKALPAGRPTPRTVAKELREREDRIARMIQERIASGDSAEDAAAAAQRAVPMPEGADESGVITALVKNGPTAPGESEVGRGLVRRLQDEHDRKIAAGQPWNAGDKVRMFVGDKLEWVGRIRSASDAANAHVVNRMERSRQAARQVAEEGGNPLRGAGRRRAMELEAQTGTTAAEQAKTEAELATFRNDPGDFGNRLAVVARHPIGNLIMPILKTSYNITRRGIERTPGAGLVAMGAEGLANAAKGKGFTVERAGEKLADQALGMAIFLKASDMATQGVITGSGPDDQRTRDILQAQGWRPHSVLIGDRYYAYDRLPGPIAWPLALAAAWGEANLYHKPDEEFSQIAGDAAGNFGRWGSDQLFVRSFADLYNALQNSDTKAPGWAANLATSFGSYLTGGLGQAVESARDPYQRETDGLEALTFRVPGQRQNLPERRDLFDNPIPNPEHGWGVLSPVTWGPSMNDIEDKQRSLRRYRGSESAAEDYRISQAVRQMEDWIDAGRPAALRPGEEAEDLYHRFRSRENPEYDRVLEAARASKEKRDLELAQAR